MQKIWTFVKNGNSPPATLMDVPEGVVCVVNVSGLQEVLLRTRSGSIAFSVTKDGGRLYQQGSASAYKFLAYYGTPPVEPLPATLRDAKPYQLVKLATLERFYWKVGNNMIWSLSEDGTTARGSVSSACMRFAVTSVSNLTAVLTEV